MNTISTPQCGRCSTTDRARFDYPADGLCSDCLYGLLDQTANNHTTLEDAMGPIDPNPLNELDTFERPAGLTEIRWHLLTPIQRAVALHNHHRTIASVPADQVREFEDQCGYRAMTDSCGPEWEYGTGWQVATWCLGPTVTDLGFKTAMTGRRYEDFSEDLVHSYLVDGLVVHIIL